MRFRRTIALAAVPALGLLAGPLPAQAAPDRVPDRHRLRRRRRHRRPDRHRRRARRAAPRRQRGRRRRGRRRHPRRHRAVLRRHRRRRLLRLLRRPAAPGAHHRRSRVRARPTMTAGPLHRPGRRPALRLPGGPGQRPLGRRARHAGHLGGRGRAVGHPVAGQPAAAGRRGRRPGFPGRRHLPPADRRQRRRVRPVRRRPASCTCPAAQPPAVGSTQRNPDLADTYRLIARRGTGVFYRGPVGADDRPDRAAPAGRGPPDRHVGYPIRPGTLTARDLARYQLNFPAPTHVRLPRPGRVRDVHAVQRRHRGR